MAAGCWKYGQPGGAPQAAELYMSVVEGVLTNEVVWADSGISGVFCICNAIGLDEASHIKKS